MKLMLQILACILSSYSLFSQTSYSGIIDKYPIELDTYIYSDGDARAIYSYTNIDEPIIINGRLKQKQLTLFENDKDGKNRATLTFDNFDEKGKELIGFWTDLKSGKQLSIKLTKMFDIEYGDSIEWTNRELLQSASLKDKYFKVITSKEKGNFYAKVTGVKILEKKTDKLIQQIKLDCELLGLQSISIGDYNFDGIYEFSVFESSYAGPNTSSLYFLYNPGTNKYFESGFRGASLEFDNEAKRIYEHNQCCAGKSHINAEYKVVNNKMILIKQTCLEYDEKKDDFIEVRCE